MPVRSEALLRAHSLHANQRREQRQHLASVNGELASAPTTNAVLMIESVNPADTTRGVVTTPSVRLADEPPGSTSCNTRRTMSSWMDGLSSFLPSFLPLSLSFFS